MRRFLKLSVYIAVAGGTLTQSFVSRTQATGVVQELTRIEHRLAKAAVDKDLESYGSLLAADWTTIDLTGRVLSKAQVMQELASEDRKIDSAAIDEIKVKELGDVAIVTGRTTAAGSYKGQRASVVLRFTDIFVRRDGRWLVVASQGTQVAR